MENHSDSKTPAAPAWPLVLSLIPVVLLVAGYLLAWQKEVFFCLTGLWLLLLPVFFVRSGVLNRGRNAWLVLTTLVLGTAAVMTGAWFETYARLFVSFLCFFLLFLLNSNGNRSASGQLILYLYPSGAYLLLLAGSTMRGGSVAFYPIVFLPIMALLLFAPILILIRQHIIRILLGLSLSWLMAYQLYGVYLQLIMGKQIPAEKAAFALHPLYDEAGVLFKTDSAYYDKIVVLDFWHSKCGACFKSFPDFQQLQQKYAGDTDVLLAAVNVALSSDTAMQYVDMLRTYPFRKFRSRGSVEENEWQISAYPTTLVFDRHGRERFRGLALYEPGPNYLPDIIEKLKNEE